MGAVLGTKRVFKVREDIEGQGKTALDIFYELGLELSDVNVLYTAFWDIDADGSGTIMPAELFSYFEVESTPFERAIFMLFDEDDSGLINFMEFVCSIWNILTLAKEEMGSLAFLVGDRTGSKTITYEDMANIFEVMHKKRVEKDPSLQTLMLAARKSLRRDISIESFAAFTRKHPSTLIPLHMLQMHLRRQIIGETFWARLQEQRDEDDELKSVRYMTTLQRRVLAQNRKFMLARMASARERDYRQRRGLGPGGDQRDTKERKQSMMIRHFALRQDSHARTERQKRAGGVYASASASNAAAENKQQKGSGEMGKLDFPNTASGGSGGINGSSRDKAKISESNVDAIADTAVDAEEGNEASEILSPAVMNNASLKRQPSTRVVPRKSRSHFSVFNWFFASSSSSSSSINRAPSHRSLIRKSDGAKDGSSKKKKRKNDNGQHDSKDPSTASPGKTDSSKKNKKKNHHHQQQQPSSPSQSGSPSASPSPSRKANVQVHPTTAAITDNTSRSVDDFGTPSTQATQASGKSPNTSQHQQQQQHDSSKKSRKKDNLKNTNAGPELPADKQGADADGKHGADQSSGKKKHAAPVTTSTTTATTAAGDKKDKKSGTDAGKTHDSNKHNKSNKSNKSNKNSKSNNDNSSGSSSPSPTPHGYQLPPLQERQMRRNMQEQESEVFNINGR